MTLGVKIYIFVGAAILIASLIFGAQLWHRRTISALENAAEAAKQAAFVSHRSAAAKEIEAAEYKQKIEYLERQLVEIQTIARRQDEELEKLNVNSGRARSDLERARSTRSIAATAGELCAKLAELGHACR